MRLFILLFIGFIALGSQGISRVGGGTLALKSDYSQFQVQSPDQFNRLRDIGTEKVELSGPFVVVSRSLQPLKLEVSEFLSVFPELKSLTAEQISEYANTKGWQQVNHSSCALVFRVNSDSAMGLVGTWGDGRGFVVLGLSSSLTDQAMSQMVTSLSLSDEACAWK